MSEGTNLFAVFCGCVVAISFYAGINHYLYKPNIIPKIDKVQSGYIPPNKLEIKCVDLDNNGELETIIKIRGKPYLLRELNGKPIISDFEIKPIE